MGNTGANNADGFSSVGCYDGIIKDEIIYEAIKNDSRYQTPN